MRDWKDADIERARKWAGEWTDADTEALWHFAGGGVPLFNRAAIEIRRLQAVLLAERKAWLKVLGIVQPDGAEPFTPDQAARLLEAAGLAEES